MKLFKLLSKFVDYADSQQYCWFRLSYGKVGSRPGNWVAWFEYLSYSPDCDHTQGDATLLGALQKLDAAMWPKK